MLHPIKSLKSLELMSQRPIYSIFKAQTKGFRFHSSELTSSLARIERGILFTLNLKKQKAILASLKRSIGGG